MAIDIDKEFELAKSTVSKFTKNLNIENDAYLTLTFIEWLATNYCGINLQKDNQKNNFLKLF